jgi:predicted pyridoxine 5'-phosphate oxidase superfamily flavin-nucleotide-binding protein
MNTEANVVDLPFFTPAVKPTLLRLGSSDDYSRTEGGSVRTQLGPRETAFVAGLDSFYVAAFGEDRWPYTQRHRGPKGFLRALDTTILGFASFSGNRRYISTGNALLFLIDHGSRTRLKIWANAEVSKDRSIMQQLATGSGQTPTTHLAFLFHVRAFGWNYEKDVAPGLKRIVQKMETPRSDRSDLCLSRPRFEKRCLARDANTGIWTLPSHGVGVEIRE